MAKTKENPATSEEFVPPFDWDQDSAHHYLIVDLPGFKKDQVRLQVNNGEEIIASGERQAMEKKNVRFALTHKIPENSIADKITGKFEEGVLYVTIPKQVKQDCQERCPVKEEEVDWGIILEYKGIIITAVLAFSLGVLVSRKWRTNT